MFHYVDVVHGRIAVMRHDDGVGSTCVLDFLDGNMATKIACKMNLNPANSDALSVNGEKAESNG